jgi:hypothetical protein
VDGCPECQRRPVGVQRSGPISLFRRQELNGKRPVLSERFGGPGDLLRNFIAFIAPHRPAT